MVGEKIRINIQLIVGTDGSHAWAIREDVIIHELDDFRGTIETKIIRFMRTLILIPDANGAVQAPDASIQESF